MGINVFRLEDEPYYKNVPIGTDCLLTAPEILHHVLRTNDQQLRTIG